MKGLCEGVVGRLGGACMSGGGEGVGDKNGCVVIEGKRKHV